MDNFIKWLLRGCIAFEEFDPFLHFLMRYFSDSLEMEERTQ